MPAQALTEGDCTGGHCGSYVLQFHKEDFPDDVESDSLAAYVEAVARRGAPLIVVGLLAVLVFLVWVRSRKRAVNFFGYFS